MLWNPKIQGYAHFAKFGGPMNSAMRPQKKPNTLKRAFSAIQTHTQCAFELK